MNKVKSISILGLFTAITIFLAGTIGFIPIGPISITTMHIPVIICAILYGRSYGAVMGLIFGLISLTRAYTNPNITSFIFMNPIVSVLPRIIFGYLAGLIYEYLQANYDRRMKNIFLIILAILAITCLYLAFSYTRGLRYLAILLFVGLAVLFLYLARRNNRQTISAGITALVSTAIHSILVLSCIYILYANQYIEALAMAVDIIVLTAAINMVLEMIVSAILVSPIVAGLKKGVK